MEIRTTPLTDGIYQARCKRDPPHSVREGQANIRSVVTAVTEANPEFLVSLIHADCERDGTVTIEYRKLQK